MRFSIGHRLFAAVLLALLAVAATGIGLMRSKVLGSFAEYAVEIELDRLEELSGSLSAAYKSHGNWGFVPPEAGWIRSELRRLERARSSPAEPLPPAPQVAAPAAPAAPASPEAPVAAAPAIPVAPLPPAPPAPPVPPPAPTLPRLPAPSNIATVASSDTERAPLQDRIALLDADGRYLAGARSAADLGVRRAILSAGKPVGYLAVARALAPSDAPALAFLAQLKNAMLAIVAISIALSALAAILLAAHFRKPIHRLADGARALADGKFDTRIEVARSDELGELAARFNQLAARLGTMEQSRRQWVADTSHELRTPLAVLRAQMEAIQDGVRPPDRSAIDAMLRQVLSLNKLIDELYALARADLDMGGDASVPVDAWDLARAEALDFEPRLAAAGLALELDAGDTTLPAHGDPERLRQVVRNVLENSARYTASGGKVRLSLKGRSICIEDSAPGVPDEALPRLAERFYRVDASRSRAQGGAGLGLALCERIMQAHGGKIAFSHSPLGGLRVELHFA